MAAKEANAVSDKYDADIRDMSKKVQKLEVILKGFYHEINKSGCCNKLMNLRFTFYIFSNLLGQ